MFFKNLKAKNFAKFSTIPVKRNMLIPSKEIELRVKKCVCLQDLCSTKMHLQGLIIFLNFEVQFGRAVFVTLVI